MGKENINKVINKSTSKRIKVENIPLYNISSAARILRLSVHTLRMYEKEGLIKPYKKTSKHRLYSEYDIERLKCIRNSIRIKKYTIPAIKTMYSFIPCWSIVNCTQEERENCPAYLKSDNPCWNYDHKDNICATKNCRECVVYTQFINCETIKEKIKELTK